MWQSSNTKCAQVNTMYTGDMHIYSFLLCLWHSHVQFCNNKLENLTLWYLQFKKSCSTIIITVYSVINKQHVFKFNTIMLQISFWCSCPLLFQTYTKC
jgi:hypothetical protein